jgi:hypothetical protein
VRDSNPVLYVILGSIVGLLWIISNLLKEISGKL